MLIVAAGVIALGAVLDSAHAAPPAPQVVTATATAVAARVVPVRVASTVSVHALPDRNADVVAVLFTGASTTADARIEHSDWVRVAYPPGDGRGWVRISSLEANKDALATLPAAGIPVANGDAKPSDPLPDLAIEQVSLLPGNVVSLVLRNAGTVSLTEASITLRVTSPFGELVSLLRVGPTTLPAHGSATVVTPLTVVERGAYRFELDPDNDIPEVDDSNNSYLAVLEPPPAPSPTPAP